MFSIARSLLAGFIFLRAASYADSSPPPIFSSVASPPVQETAAKEIVWRFSLGPGAAVFQGTLGGRLSAETTALAMDLSLTTRADASSSLWVGVDTGFYFWSPSNSVTSSNGSTGVHLLPTALYRFQTSHRDIHPFIGIALGPHLLFSYSSPAAFLEILFRGGVEWELSREIAFVFEPKLGILDSNFVAIPQAALLLNLE